MITKGSFPLSDTVQYSTVRFNSGQYTLILLAFPTPRGPLLDRGSVCRKVVTDVIHAQRRKRDIVYEYENIKYTYIFFVFVHSDVNKPNTGASWWIE